MGCASRVTPGKPQIASPVSSLPIENSPPGIHTMPSGLEPGAGVLLGMVGAKDEASALCGVPELETGTGVGRDLTNATTPATTNAAAISRHIAVDREAGAGFCASGLLFFALLMLVPQRSINPLDARLKTVRVAGGA